MITGQTSRLNTRLFATFLLLVILFGSFIHAATAQVVALSVGYLNNLAGQPPIEFAPFPFDPDDTTILISSGNAASSHDTGIILFENLTEFAVTIDRGLRVTTDSRDRQSLPPLFQIWDGFLPIVLPPGQSLVLAETVNFNFDTSDVRDFTVDNPPVLSGSANGKPFSFTDRGFVLLGHADAASPDETTAYQQLGELRPPGLIGGTLQGLGAVQAECRDVNSGQVVSGSITEGTLNCVQLGLQPQAGDRVQLRLLGLARSGGPLPPQPVGAATTVVCSGGRTLTLTTGTDGGTCEPSNPMGKTVCKDDSNTATADCTTGQCGGSSGKGKCDTK